MSLDVARLEAVSLEAAKKLPDRVPMRGRAGLTRRDRRPPRIGIGQYWAEGLERRLFLSSAIAFGTPQTFATGPNAFAVVASDVNADGKPDLIVTDNDSVGVLLGNGNGTFQNEQSFVTTGIHSTAVAVADVNGDGKLDLVVANGGSYDAPGNTVSVLLGNGDGTFQFQHSFGTGSRPFSVAVADVNGDGKLDLVVANYVRQYDPATLSVLLGNGDGTFQAQRTFTTDRVPSSVAVSDVNGDGKPDLIVADRSFVDVLLGNGNGTFQSEQTFRAGVFPYSVVLADVNGDSMPDLVVANFDSNDTVSVLLGNGNGTFQPQQTFATGSRPESVAVSDMNGDGKPDLVVADALGASVSVLLGNGNGTFQAQQVFALGADARSVAVSDVNGDGIADVVVASRYSDDVTVLLADVPPVVLSMNRATPAGPIISNTSSVSYTATFNEPVTGVDATDFGLTLSGVTATTPVLVTPVSSSIYTVTISGISGIGTLGLHLADDSSIQDAAGNSLRPFLPEQTFAVGARPVSMVALDLNGDGNRDVVVANMNDNTLSVLLGNGDGTFQAEMTFATGLLPVSMALGDVNGDGKPDVVVANGVSNTVSVLMGNGDGTFRAQQTFATGVEPRSVAVLDVNGDGRPDLVVANAGVYASPGNTVSVLLGNGNGTFGAQHAFATGQFPYSVAISDVNGDGRPDLLVANKIYMGAGTVSVLLGNGNGTFQAQQTVAAGTNPIFITVSDLNADGRPDLIVTGDAVGVLLGNGNGTFQAEQTFATGANPFSVAVSDVNGDGKLDLVVANNFNSGSVSLLLGNGNGAFQAQQTFGTGSNPDSVAVADVNGDGTPDLLVADKAGSYSVSVLLGNSDANFTGQVYTIVPLLDTITGTASADQITLVPDPDHVHIDWTMGTSTAQMLINDAIGLTINGNGNNDVITLNFMHGSPLPHTLHLNGTFTINGLQGTNPLANTAIDLGQSTAYFSYTFGVSPAAAIQAALKSGYNGGAWNGSGASINGAIESGAAAGGAVSKFGVGFSDSADGIVVGQPVNTVEIRYTVMGDTNLDRVVNSTDAVTMARNYLVAGKTAWDLGNFNYDTTINLSDAMLLQKNFNATASGSVVAAAVNSAASFSGGGLPAVTREVSSTGDGGLSVWDSVGRGHKPKRRGMELRRERRS